MPGDQGKDAEDKTVSVLRVSLAMIAFVFVVYLTPGHVGRSAQSVGRISASHVYTRF
jgi:hypothetical protein